MMECTEIPVKDTVYVAKRVDTRRKRSVSNVTDFRPKNPVDIYYPYTLSSVRVKGYRGKNTQEVFYYRNSVTFDTLT